jgi:two-component system response regulator FixJ
MSQMKIYIVDDNTDYRMSTSWWLQGLGYKVKDFTSGSSFLHWLEDHSLTDNECLLLDVRMPEMSGLELHERLNDTGKHLPVIYMTGHADVPIAVEAMRKGAVTFLEKPIDSNSLESALDSAFASNHSHAAQVSEPAAAFTYSTEQKHAKAAYERRLSTLTPREKEVLEGVVAGKMNKVLAADMGISIKTIEIHRSQIKKKMKVRNTAELIKMVVQGEVHE